MCLPYGALVAAGGLIAKVVGWGQPAIVMMAVGVLQLVLASLSLKVWRQSKSAAPFTLVEAGKCCVRLLLQISGGGVGLSDASARATPFGSGKSSWPQLGRCTGCCAAPSSTASVRPSAAL